MTVPYLFRVIGADKFGLIAFATVTIGYFQILTDYGFNLSATQKVSVNRGDHNKLIEIYSSVMTVKFILLILSTLLLSILLIFDKFNSDKEVYILTFGNVIGQFLFPIWLFQGLEKLKVVSIINLLTKVFFTLSIFIFVKVQADYIYVPILTSLGSIVSGVISLIIVNKYLFITYKIVNFSCVKKQFFEGWHIFISTVSVSFYTISSTFVLGLLTNVTAVGYFSSADKLIQAIKGLYGPISQAMYPLASKKIYDDKAKGIKFVMRVGYIISCFMLFICFFLFIFSEEIVYLFYGGNYKEIIYLLKMMSILPVLITISNILGIQLMINLGYKKQFSIILFFSALLGIISNFILTYLYGAIGTTISVVFIECFVTITMLFFIIKKRKIDFV